MRDRAPQPPNKRRDLSTEIGMPVNLEAERIVLGLAMRESATVDEITQSLSETDFSLEKHRKIFSIIREINDMGMPVDVAMVGNTLVTKGQLEAIDGLTYLMDISLSSDPVVITGNCRPYIESVKERATRRNIIFMAQEMLDNAFLGEQNNAEILLSAETKIEAFRAGGTSIGTSARTMKQFIDQQGANRLLDVSNRQKGILTGLRRFDELTGGFRPGDIFVVGARPGVGKTITGLNFADLVAMRSPGWVQLFTLEMFLEPLFDRLLARASGLDFRVLARDGMSQDDRDKLQAGLLELYEKRIVIDDEPGLSMVDIYNRVRAMQRIAPVSMVIVDYLQLVHPADRKKLYPNENAQLTAISNELQWASKKLKLPFIVLSQLRRPDDKGKKDKRPDIEELRGSGSIEQVAWRILLLHRSGKADDPGSRDDVDGILGKNRLGPIGEIKFRIGGARSTITEIEDV